MHHGYKPFGVRHAKVDSICDSSLLEAISHVPNILLFNVVEVVEAIEACLSADGCLLIRDPKPNPVETLVHYDVWINHSRLVVNGMYVSRGCLHRNNETGKPLLTSQHSRQGDQSQQLFSKPHGPHRS